MHRLKNRALRIALGGAAADGLVLASAATASAASLPAGGGGYGFVYTSTNSAAGIGPAVRRPYSYAAAPAGVTVRI